MPRPYILQPKDLSRPAGRQAKSRIFFRLCKTPRDFDFWNSQSARVAFSAEFRNRPAGIRRRNFFSGGRRKNAVFSPREKSEFPLQECSVNLHYKIGGQIWSGNPAENRPPPRPPRRWGAADGFDQSQAVFAQAPWNLAADGGESGPGEDFQLQGRFARPA